jgi:hypothetical protein
MRLKKFKMQRILQFFAEPNSSTTTVTSPDVATVRRDDIVIKGFVD